MNRSVAAAALLAVLGLGCWWMLASKPVATPEIRAPDPSPAAAVSPRTQRREATREAARQEEAQPDEQPAAEPAVGASAEGVARIDVTVLDPDGHPAPATNIFCGCGAWGTATGVVADGRRILEITHPGRCVVRVATDRWPVFQTEIDVASGESKELTAHLQRGVAISGWVVDDAGAPVERATVTAEGRDSGGFAFMRSASSAPDGTFEITGLEATSYAVGASDFDQEGTRLVGIAAPSCGLRLVFTRSGWALRLRLPDGVPTPAGYFLRCVRRLNGGLHPECMEMNAHAWGDGDVSMSLAPDRWTVEVSVDGFELVTRTLEIRPGETSKMDDVLLERAAEK